MNILHCKGRSRLITTRVNKLLFIQINRRTLNRKLQKKDDEKNDEQKEQQEELVGDTNEADDVEMESNDELQGL
jgi:hypothetical protein